MFYKHLARLIFPFLLVMATLSLSTASFADSDHVSSANVKANSALVTAGSGPGGVGTTDGTSELELWLRADTGFTTSGNDTTWADQSGNGLSATETEASNDPTFTDNELNGQPVIRFDGTDDYLNLGQPASLDFYNSMPNFTIILVGDDNAGSVLFSKNGTTSETQSYLSISEGSTTMFFTIKELSMS